MRTLANETVKVERNREYYSLERRMGEHEMSGSGYGGDGLYASDFDNVTLRLQAFRVSDFANVLRIARDAQDKRTSCGKRVVYFCDEMLTMMRETRKEAEGYLEDARKERRAAKRAAKAQSAKGARKGRKLAKARKA